MNEIISDFPAPERSGQYRVLAKHASRTANMTVSEKMRDAYKLMAAQWLKLADETDALAERDRTLSERESALAASSCAVAAPPSVLGDSADES